MTPNELKKLADEATPGPWAVADIPNGQSVRIPLGGHDSFRFFTHTSGNARLIALAPDLARLCAAFAVAAEQVIRCGDEEPLKGFAEAARYDLAIPLAKFAELEPVA